MKENKRLWVTLSFAFVFLLGVPIWWKSTEIYRAELPYQEIENWNRLEIYNEPFHVKLDVYLPSSWIQSKNEHVKTLSNLLESEKLKDQENSCQIKYQVDILSNSDLSSQTTCENVENWMKEKGNKSQNGRYSFVSVNNPTHDKKFIICPSRIVLMNMDQNENSRTQIISWLRSISEITARRLVSSPNTEEKVSFLV